MIKRGIGEPLWNGRTVPAPQIRFPILLRRPPEMAEGLLIKQIEKGVCNRIFFSFLFFDPTIHLFIIFLISIVRELFQYFLLLLFQNVKGTRKGMKPFIAWNAELDETLIWEPGLLS